MMSDKISEITPIYNHTSEETAYLVRSYPYSFKLRCRIRFWLEFKPSMGFRFVSQTENPKNLRWNKPKAGTYSKLGANLYIDSNSHVHHRSLTEYTTAGEILEFLTDFPETLISDNLKAYVVTSRKIADRRSQGIPTYSIGGKPVALTNSEIESAKAEIPVWDEIIQILALKLIDSKA